MAEIPLNKFEKEKKVIELHKQGKTIRQIAPEVHMAFRDISKIIKAYDKKMRLETKKEENNPPNQKIKKPPISSRAFKLFLDGKTPVQVAIDLELDFQSVRKFWTEFLRLQNMTKLYNIYIENEFHLDYLLKIYYFMLRNNISIRDTENVLRNADNVINLNKIISNLKAEIEKLKQHKNTYSLNQNKPILPLGLPAHYYRYYNNY